MHNSFYFAGSGRRAAQYGLCAALTVCVTLLPAGCGGGNGSTGTQQTASSGSGGSGSGSSGSGSGSGSGSSGSGSGSGSGSSGSGSSGDAQPAGTTLAAMQTPAGNWESWGQKGPSFVDCKAPCKESSWQQVYGIQSPSKSGNATRYEVNPKMPYADVLFSAQLIGEGAPKRQDADHKLLPSIHQLTYDADFYVNDPAVTQALEFDLSLWMSGVTGETFGTQCDHLGDGQWDVWNTAASQWKPTGKPCRFAYGWNHVTLQFERESNNDTLYKSITLNGTTYALNTMYPPAKAPGGWWGLTANYQMDSDAQGSQNTTYLDNLNITYE
ncbi:MAG TPA: hypothetical protein VHX13_07145 [Acidobacteriaceae bacterium]|nr:hypothetical protein [Acidobacteriaceae bacterium]